jgi:peptidylprolyl isomerase/FKBP-type peptidyl-prolyl cis-trans isomerase FkpA
MNKNLLVSILILAAFGSLIYFSLKSAPKEEQEEVINNISTEENMNNDSAQQPGGEEVNIQMPQMQIIKEGSGEKAVKTGDTVAVFYTGYLTNGEVFDSNVGGNTFEFTVGAGQVIAGWEVGLIDMKIGEVRRLVLPPEFAYGSQAVGPIPANSTLVFDVELAAIK